MPLMLTFERKEFLMNSLIKIEKLLNIKLVYAIILNFLLFYQNSERLLMSHNYKNTLHELCKKKINITKLR